MTAERDSMTLQEMGAPALGVEEPRTAVARSWPGHGQGPRTVAPGTPGTGASKTPRSPEKATQEE